MPQEHELLAQRRANMEALAQLGVDLYPHEFDRTDTVHGLVTAHGERAKEDLEATRIETKTCGRILAIRSFGKANFLVLSDGRARIQVYIRQDSMPGLDFQVFKLLDLGDFVGVSGHLFRTKTNEFTIWASGLTFLAKCLLPLPEKWHGLQDIEIRYRQRYLDLIVTPGTRRVFEARSRTLAAIRDFLDARGYLEVETPMMQQVAGGALARPFVTHHNALDMRLYLRIAPELYLKRLLVGGMERVYEINRNFRNEGISTQHNPEFTMLEFYQAYSNYLELMDMTELMLSEVARKVTGGEDVTYGETTISFKAPFRRLSMRGAVCEEAARRLGREVTEAELRDVGSARALSGQLGVEPARRRVGQGALRPVGRRTRAGHGSGQDHGRGVRDAVGSVARAADVRLRLPDRGLASLQAEAGRLGHGGAVRAVRRRLRARQRLQRTERPG